MSVGSERRTLSFSGLAADHELPILELHADTDYSIAVTVTDEEGRSAVEELSLVTRSLPERFPLFELLVHVPDAMAPGYTIADLKTGEPAEQFVAIFDPDFEPVWIWKSTDIVTDSRVTEDGHLFLLHDGDITEVDLLGNDLGKWDDAPRYMHHEFFPMPGGGAVTLGADKVTVPFFPLNYERPEELRTDVEVSDSEVVVLDADGQVNTVWPILEIADPMRVAFDSQNNTSNGVDWVHANGVIPDPSDGGFLISLRHQDCVVKVDSDGDLVWILGNHYGWSPAFTPYLLEPVGDLLWPWHPHAPMIAADGTVALMDNGNFGHTPYDDEIVDPLDWYSRAVGYRVDSEAMTVEQLWEVEASTGPIFSGGLGDADLLDNGNVLMVLGWILMEDGLENADHGRGLRSSRLVEKDPFGEYALDLRIWGTLEDHPKGWKVYRADRFSSLYRVDQRPSIRVDL